MTPARRLLVVAVLGAGVEATQVAARLEPLAHKIGEAL